MEHGIGSPPVDTPRAAYSLVGRRATVGVVGTLLVLAAVSWAVTATQAPSMAGMGALALVAGGMSMAVSVPLFMGMWLAMMVAMMFPAVAPMVLAHRMVTRRRGEGPRSSVAFVAGYIGVWTAVGVLPLALFALFRAGARPMIGGTALAIVAGAVLALAGAYQFTGWKSTCLRACRTPLGFIMTHDFQSGSRGAVRAGIAHGAYCLGCCWALMAVLLMVGLMNLGWMAVLALVFHLEKNWGHGVGLTRAVGAALIVLGLVVAVDPALLQFLAGVPSAQPALGGGM